jgi:hypothetical protein
VLHGRVKSRVREASDIGDNLLPMQMERRERTGHSVTGLYWGTTAALRHVVAEMTGAVHQKRW